MVSDPSFRRWLPLANPDEFLAFLDECTSRAPTNLTRIPIGRGLGFIHYREWHESWPRGERTVRYFLSAHTEGAFGREDWGSVAAFDVTSDAEGGFKVAGAPLAEGAEPLFEELCAAINRQWPRAELTSDLLALLQKRAAQEPEQAERRFLLLVEAARDRIEQWAHMAKNDPELLARLQASLVSPEGLAQLQASPALRDSSGAATSPPKRGGRPKGAATGLSRAEWLAKASEIKKLRDRDATWKEVERQTGVVPRTAKRWLDGLKSDQADNPSQN